MSIAAPDILILTTATADGQQIVETLARAGYLGQVVLATQDFRPQLHSGEVRLVVVLEPCTPLTAYELCQAIRFDRPSTLIPILVILEKESQRDTFTVLGVDGLFVKPLDEYAFLSQVACCLSRRVGSTQSPQDLSRQAAFCQKKILLVSPNMPVVVKMARLLLAAKQEVVSARDGGEALCHASIFSPEIALVDVSAGEDAVVTARMLLQLNLPTRLAVLLFSCPGVSGGEDGVQQIFDTDLCIQACFKAGAFAYLGPFSEPMFLRIIKPYLVPTTGGKS